MKLRSLYNSWSRNERLIFWGALMVFIITLVIRTSFYIQDNMTLAPKRGGEFREGIVGQPIFINPAVPGSEADRDLSRLVFSSVTDVAESIKLAKEDKLIYSVRIKENIRWQDGERLTSDDIIFTIQTIQDPGARSPLLASFQGVMAERVSELEVKFILQSPYAFFEEDHLKNLLIIPKHIFADTPVENLKFSVYGLKPVGSGPYKVASYKSDEKGVINIMNLEENSGYFGDKPYIPKLTFKFYRNTSELLNAYNSGQIDGFGLSTAESLVEVGLRHNVYYLPSSRYYAVFINQSAGNEKLKDLKVRKAMDSAVDRTKLANDIFQSHATILYGPTVFTEESNSTIDTSLLNGLELNLTVPEEPFLIKTANSIKSSWESYGARVSIRTLPLKSIQEDILRNTDYELLLFGNIVKEGQDLFAFWHSSRRFYPDQNLALYQNKDVDSELETYRKTFDEQERMNKLEKISNMIASDAPAVFLYSPDYLYIATPNLGGIDKTKVINTASDRFADITKWYVKTKRAFK
ncbi:MAG: hypothetical protein AUJ39_01165 [Parcubacteria group bacterium CG1_02_42_13]|nr:MAG: hypothetical protein AUJ39_01165 [Parcubacteria group bacterium CG1_02_42_13]